MSSSKKPVEPPVAAEGGVRKPMPPDEDPYRALDDLMAAIEVLRPQWPERETFRNMHKMLL